MDKKKVEELMEQIDFIAHDFIDGDKQEKLQELVSEVQEELNKSDWVSVEDGLPPYYEDVDVRMESKHDICYRTSKRVKSMEQNRHIDYDKDDFVTLGYIYHVTHWRKIEKLEE